MQSKTMRQALLAAAASAAMLATAGAAVAGGLAVREQSTSSQGASFAGSAAGGDLSSMFWNPAAAGMRRLGVLHGEPLRADHSGRDADGRPAGALRPAGFPTRPTSATSAAGPGELCVLPDQQGSGAGDCRSTRRSDWRPSQIPYFWARQRSSVRPAKLFTANAAPTPELPNCARVCSLAPAFSSKYAKLDVQVRRRAHCHRRRRSLRSMMTWASASRPASCGSRRKIDEHRPWASVPPLRTNMDGDLRDGRRSGCDPASALTLGDCRRSLP